MGGPGKSGIDGYAKVFCTVYGIKDVSMQGVVMYKGVFFPGGPENITFGRMESHEPGCFPGC